MANYCGFTRTNYFRVKDENRFREIISSIMAEDNVEIWEGENGAFAFGAYDSLNRCHPDVNNKDTDEADTENSEGDGDGEEYEDTYDFDDVDALDCLDLAELLQEVVADDDAIIITEVGYEKLRYVGGFSTIISCNGIKHINLISSAVDEARTMLGKNKDWTTKTDY